MKISAYTVGDISVASSRLRSFYLFSLAAEFGIEVTWPIKFRDALSSNIVHIQKIITPKIIIVIMIYRLLGIKVIFDIDDQPGSKLKSFLGCMVILYLANVVTVDSDARKDFWKKYLLFKKIVVINDVADTHDFDLTIKKLREQRNARSFFWIGHSSNIFSIEEFIEFGVMTKGYSLTISTNEDAMERLRVRYPAVNFIPWSMDVAFDEKIDATFMILNHSLGLVSPFKSENKMVLAILAGFIPLVSRTPAYEKLATSLNSKFLIFDSFEEVPEIAEEIACSQVDLFSNEKLSFLSANYSRFSVLAAFVSNVLGRSDLVPK